MYWTITRRADGVMAWHPRKSLDYEGAVKRAKRISHRLERAGWTIQGRADHTIHLTKPHYKDLYITIEELKLCKDLLR
jgi:hypothetical protein